MGNYAEEYQTTTEDYWSRYPTAAPVDDGNRDSRYQTPYPGYEANTPDYYGRYGGQQTTQDYWAARYPATTPPSREDAYGRTGLMGTVTAAPQTTDIYWSPYWGAATEPSRAATAAPSWSGGSSAGGSAWSGSSSSGGGRHSATRQLKSTSIHAMSCNFQTCQLILLSVLQPAVPIHQATFALTLWKTQQRPS